MSAIYVHIPFCRRRCLYCDFFATAESRADWDTYVSAILSEAAPYAGSETYSAPCTLYIGGGTPSLVPPEQFKRLTDGLKRFFGTPEEFTIEVNPDDVTADMADMWREAGVTRISMGVQSLNDAELRAVGRRHDAREAFEAYRILRERFDNISLDLMFGLPGQTLDSLIETVEKFILLKPEHISAYSLTFEERSALSKLRELGKVEEADEDLSYRMFDTVSTMLAKAGYEQYEISNFALKGRRSLHNSHYWTGGAYLGLGPGAHSFNGIRTRRANLPDIENYIKFYLSNPHPNDISVSDFEFLTDHELREEMIMTRLRCAEGLDLAEYKRRFGELERLKILNKAKKYEESGHLKTTSRKIKLTREGYFISDEIISSLF